MIIWKEKVRNDKIMSITDNNGDNNNKYSPEDLALSIKTC